jgi:hypothetical protein
MLIVAMEIGLTGGTLYTRQPASPILGFVWLSQRAMTKHQKQEKFILSLSGGQKFKVRVSAGSGSIPRSREGSCLPLSALCCATPASAFLCPLLFWYGHQSLD